MTWDEIAGGESLHHYLNKIQEDYPQVQGIWLADPAGIIRNSSRFFPTPPADVSDRITFLLCKGPTTAPSLAIRCMAVSCRNSTSISHAAAEVRPTPLMA